ncbi:HesA/MoeB/ThiF family protein [bacterium]|nr:MAG: HesA/MoeB/ThiF family protein [bacterium]
MSAENIYSDERLTQEEIARYQRQIIIPAIGEEGQKKIKEAKVFVAGAGGLGSVSAYYLAAAGVGRLIIVDSDNVEIGNLNRQIIHRTDDIGTPKVDSAAAKLKTLNPQCVVTPIRADMRKDNIIDLSEGCSVIVDATDNLATRRVLNHASLAMGIPFIYGGVNEFNGMVTTFVPGKTPCFECLFSTFEEQKKTIGVIGPVPGVIASLQTLEVLKIILGIKGLLMERLLFFSAIDMKFKEIIAEKNPECPACGKKAEGKDEHG